MLLGHENKRFQNKKVVSGAVPFFYVTKIQKKNPEKNIILLWKENKKYGSVHLQHLNRQVLFPMILTSNCTIISPRYFRIDRSELWRQNAKRCKPNHVGSQTSWLNLVWIIQEWNVFTLICGSHGVGVLHRQ